MVSSRAERKQPGIQVKMIEKTGQRSQRKLGAGRGHDSRVVQGCYGQDVRGKSADQAKRSKSLATLRGKSG
jgi:hypothetical protein